MNQTYLITGGNIGDRRKNLEQAAHYIEEKIGPILKSSAIYETAAWGNTDQASFYNQVHLVETELTPDDLMVIILSIEHEMGRIRTEKNAARIIDIDILFFNKEIIDTESVVVPHKEIPNRKFVLKPLLELAPDFIHPLSHKTIAQLDAETSDQLEVWVVEDKIPEVKIAEEKTAEKMTGSEETI